MSETARSHWWAHSGTEQLFSFTRNNSPEALAGGEIVLLDDPAIVLSQAQFPYLGDKGGRVYKNLVADKNGKVSILREHPIQ